MLQKIIQCSSIRNCFNCQITQKHVLSFCIGYCYGSEETGCIDTLQHSRPTNSLLVFVEGLKGAWSFLLVKGLYCKVWPWMAVPFTQTGVLLCFWFGQTFKTNLQIKKTWLNVIVGITKQSSVVCSPCRCSDLGKLYTYFLHCQAINHFTTSDFLGKPLLLLSSSYKRGPYLYSHIDVGVNPFNNKENDLWNKDTDRESLGYVCTHPFDECWPKRARFMQRKLAICRSFYLLW